MGNGTTPLTAANYDDFAKSLTDYISHIKTVAGIEIEYVSINEPELWANNSIPPAGYNKIIEESIPLFSQAGLNTKWLIGNNATINLLNPGTSYNSYTYMKAQLEDANFENIRSSVQAMSYNSWDHINISSSRREGYYRRLKTLANTYSFELWCIEANFTATIPNNNDEPNGYIRSWDRAFQIIDVYHSILKYSEAEAVVYWQYQNDLRLVDTAGNIEFHAYRVLKQMLDNFTPGVQFIEAECSDSMIDILAAKKNNEISIQLLNKKGSVLDLSGNTGYKTDYISISGVPNGNYRVTYCAKGENSIVNDGIITAINGVLNVRTRPDTITSIKSE